MENGDPGFRALQYHQDIFEEQVKEDGLSVIGQGLGAFLVIRHLVRLYSNSHSLVLMIICNSRDRTVEESLARDVSSSGAQRALQLITAVTTPTERESLYREGGVLCVTARILTVDLLNRRLPAHLVTGLLLCNAEFVTPASPEAFVVRLFREQNVRAFVRAFSTDASALSSNLSHLRSVMRGCGVSRLYLWPRFRQGVDRDLDVSKSSNGTPVPNVIELKVTASDALMTLQRCLVKLMRGLLEQSIPRGNAHHKKVEHALFQVFSEDAWSSRARNDPDEESGTSDTDHLDDFDLSLVRGSKTALSSVREDILLLRKMSFVMLKQDCVSFLEHCDLVRELLAVPNRGFGDGRHSAVWLFMPETATLFDTARARVYNVRTAPPEKKRPKLDIPRESPEMVWFAECNVAPVLEENPKWALLRQTLVEIASVNKDDSRVAIFVQSQNVADQLKDVLTLGSQTFLRRRLRSYLKSKRNAPKKEPALSDDRPVAVLFSNVSFVCRPRGFPAAPLFDEISPSFIILYDLDLCVVRQCEVYSKISARVHRLVTVYFISFINSFEENRYQALVEREHDGFEFLIKHRSSCGSFTLFSQNVEEKGIVVVDMREIGRAELVSRMHAASLGLRAATLGTADYVLSPDCAVERKSVGDLRSSMGTGRLYNQLEALQRSYRYPILLFEFPDGTPLFVENSIRRKVLSLCFHFPRVRLMFGTPQTIPVAFAALKETRTEPEVGTASERRPDESIWSESIHFLSRLPGVSRANLPRIRSHFRTVRDMCNASEEEICAVMGTGSGKRCWAFLHKKLGE